MRPKPILHGIFCYWIHPLKRSWLGGVVKQGAEEGDNLSQLITTVFVEQPLALHGSAHHLSDLFKNI